MQCPAGAATPVLPPLRSGSTCDRCLLRCQYGGASQDSPFVGAERSLGTSPRPASCFLGWDYKPCPPHVRTGASAGRNSRTTTGVTLSCSSDTTSKTNPEFILCLEGGRDEGRSTHQRVNVQPLPGRSVVPPAPSCLHPQFHWPHCQARDPEPG